ncbi:hypothetical protein D3C73_1303670 [compost metagenome]
MVGLHDCRQKIAHRRAGGCHHGNRRLSGEGKAQRGEPCVALIDADVEPDAARSFRFRQGVGHGC